MSYLEHKGAWMDENADDLALKNRRDRQNEKYFTVEALEDGCEVRLNKSGSPTAITCQYTIDNEVTWKTLTVGTTVIKLNTMDIVKFKCTTTTFSTSTSNYYIFNFSKKVNIYGNLASLKNFNTSMANYAFYQCFYNAPIVSAEYLNLPFETVSSYGFNNMFYNCKSLEKGPELKATKILDYAYKRMFYGCSNLISTGNIDADIIGAFGCNEMFYGCISLIKAPDILATTIENSGCYYMFLGCSSLIEGPSMSNAINIGSYGCEYMFDACSSLVTPPPILPAITLTYRCYHYMFTGCGSLTTAPIIKAIIGKEESCACMFVNCTSLINAPELNLIHVEKATCSNMFEGCTSLINGPSALYARNLDYTHSYNSMFYNCRSLTSAPIIYATDINDMSMPAMQSMFYNCKKLSNIEIYVNSFGSTTINSNHPFQYFLYGTTNVDIPLQTLHVKKSITSVSTNIIPSNWTVVNDLNEVEHIYFSEIGDTYKLPNFSGTATFESSDKPSFIGIDSNGIFSLDSTPAQDVGTFHITINKTGEDPEEKVIVFCTKYLPEQKGDYLRLTALEANSRVKFGMASTTTSSTTLDVKIEYSLDNGETWILLCTTLPLIANSTWINLNNIGDSVLFRGKHSGNRQLSYSERYGHANFKMEGKIAASGNIMSLIDFEEMNTDNCFICLFKDCTALITPPSILPATNLATHCYEGMFKGCTSITTSPVLPATTLEEGCYVGMFYGCTSLVSAPELPATTLAPGCYRTMFYDCTSLATPPILPATTLKDLCYGFMFYGCTSLASAPVLPATTLKSQGYESMFRGCTSLTTAPALPATTLATYCYQYMFQGCTSLTTAPALPAGTLLNYCYAYMFQGCTSLVTGPTISATKTVANSCTQMFDGCTSLNYVNVAFTSWVANAHTNWLRDVSATGVFRKPIALVPTRGVSNIPTDWDIQVQGVPTTPVEIYHYATTTLTTYITTSGATFSCDSLPSGLTLSGSTITGTMQNETETFTLNVTTTNDTSHVTVVMHRLTDADAIKFTATVANSQIRLLKKGSPTAITCLYSIDNGSTWTSYSVTTSSTIITLANVGDSVLFKCTTTTFATAAANYYYFAMPAGGFTVSGTVASLRNFLQECTANYQYNYLFTACTRLTSASQLMLPKKLTTSCFQYMFNGCTGLTEAPALPLTTLLANCYQYMFNGCTALTTPPALPATTMLASCYAHMFDGCTSLATAPALPAKTLANYCYAYMFQNCRALTTPPTLPATSTSATYCYQAMFNGCSGLTTAPALPAKTMGTYMYQYMFQGCTSLTTAPELPATTLTSYCYQYMFRNCTSLVNPPVLSAKTGVASCYWGMFDGCTNLSTLSMALSTFSHSYTGGFLNKVADHGHMVLLNPDTPVTYNEYYGIPKNWYCTNADGDVIGYGAETFVEIGLMGDETANLQLSCTGCPEGSTVTFEAINAPTGISVSSSGLITGSCENDEIFYVSVLIDGVARRQTKVCINHGTLEDCIRFTKTGNTSSSVKVTKTGNPENTVVKYSLNNGSTWNNFTFGTAVTVPNNTTMYVRGMGSHWSYNSVDYYRIVTAGTMAVSGNLKSLVSFTKEMRDNYEFYSLFVGSAGTLKSVENLVIPFDYITYSGLAYMFQSCTGFTTAPQLPAKSFANYAYQYMFNNCTGLTTMGDLPAEVVPSYGYFHMFDGCTKLVTMGAIGAKVVNSYAMQLMFNKCTALVTAPALNATTIATYCYEQMFTGCTKLVTPPPTLPAMTLANYCYQKMFYGNSVLETMPELPATTSVEGCYNNMFYGCKKLTATTHIATTATASKSHVSMFQTCSLLSYIDCNLAAFNSTNNANWVNGVAASGTFVKNPSLTATYGVAAIPSGWTVKSGVKVNGTNDYVKVYDSEDNTIQLDCTCSSEITYSSSNIPDAFSLSSSGVITNLSAEANRKYEFTVTATPADASLDSVTFPVAIIYRNDFLRFTAVETNSSVGFGYGYSSFTSTNTFKYSIDNGITWTQYASPSTKSVSSCEMINLPNIGDSVLFIGNGTTFSNDYGTFFFKFRMTGKISASGSVASLIDFSTNGAFFGSMFSGCTSLTTAPELPATTLAEYCYYRMFYGCTSLVNAPSSLPATTLASNCYAYMFEDCTSLVNAPSLPATTLASYCYSNMFSGCTSLVNAPSLPATTLASYCYQYMFRNCTSIIATPEIQARIFPSYCCYYMFSGCTSLETACELDIESTDTFCCEYMFSGCTSLISMPAINIINLNGTNAPLAYMFQNCSSLVKTPKLNIENVNCPAFYNGSFSGCSQLRTVSAIKIKNLNREISAHTTNQLFNNCNSLTEVEDITIEHMENSAYLSGLFYGNTTIKTVGHLTFGNVGDYCCRWMFRGCSALEYVKALNVRGSAGNNAFEVMFLGCRALTGIDVISLGTSLGDSCCSSMFQNCTSLVVAPSLPATTLADNCYDSMFYGCNSLKVAPELPATQLEYQCYHSMFQECRSLKNAPSLHATTLATGCYGAMFLGCTSLTIAPSLPATTLAEGCYNLMFRSCSSLVVAPSLPATTLTKNCYYNMFSGCTSLVNPPALPATTLADYCYYSMFGDCSSLESTPSLNVTTCAPNCFSYMFSGCSSLTLVNDIIIDTAVARCCDSMFKGCSAITTATIVSFNTMADLCCISMFQNCTSLVNAPELPSTNLAPWCYDSMFSGCTSLVTAPALPAITLAEGCYDCMFDTCTSLVNLPELPATTLAKECYECMFEEVAATTTPELPAKVVPEGAYCCMFWGCPSLVNISDIAAENVGPWAFDSTFEDCTALTTVPSFHFKTFIEDRTNSYGNCHLMFDGCTSLISVAPFPDNMVLGYKCFEEMFSNCTSLATAPSIPASTTLADNCFESMFEGCTSLVNTPALPVTTLATYCYQRMFNNCTSLTTAPSLPATTLVEGCYRYMFQNCESLINAPALSSTSLAMNCYDSMFSGCTSLTTAPSLPATTLADYCYYRMFRNCSNLSSINIDFTDWGEDNETYQWVSGVSESGTFTCSSGLEETYGNSNIPTGWTIVRK